MIKLIYEGLPDQGKSLMTAWITYQLLRRNKNWWEKGVVKKQRFVATEMELAPWVVDMFGLWPEGYIRYYKIRELPDLRQCDVIIDDMGTRFSSQRWQETPDAVRNWFRLMGHYECDVHNGQVSPGLLVLYALSVGNTGATTDCGTSGHTCISRLNYTA